jgi:hypothetical protein
MSQLSFSFESGDGPRGTTPPRRVKHGDGHWMKCEIVLGGTRFGPVHATPGAVVWPPSITFTDDALKARVEDYIKAQAQKLERDAQRPPSRGRGARR